MVLYFSLLLSAINSLKVDKYATLIQDREFQKDDAPKKLYPKPVCAALNNLACGNSFSFSQKQDSISEYGSRMYLSFGVLFF
jgi:hypothetical protein